MARKVVEDLMRILVDTSKDPILSKLDLGKFYRENSAQSRHKFIIDKSIVTGALIALLTEQGFDVNKIQNLELIATKIYKNILAAINKDNNITKYTKKDGSVSNRVFIVDAKGGNSFAIVGKVLAAGFNGSQYDLYKFLSELPDDYLIGFDKELLNTRVKETSTAAGKLKAKSGFDVGHVVSNIERTYHAVLYNKLRRLELSEEDVKAINNLFPTILTNTQVISHMSKVSGIPIEELDKLLNITLEFTRTVVNGNIHAIIKKEGKLDRTNLAKIAKEVDSVVTLESAGVNQLRGSTFEKALGKYLSNRDSKFTQLLGRWANGSIKLPGIPDITGLTGSPSIRALIENLVTDTIVTGKNKSASFTTDVATSLISSTKRAVKKVKSTLAPKVKVPKLPPLRSSLTGRFTSVTNIETLIRASLTAGIVGNMREPGLVNRTGRFASSVSLNKLDRDPRTGALQAYLSYMKYPYATFDPGGSKYTPSRSPSRLIEGTVREIASKLVTERMKVVIV